MNNFAFLLQKFLTREFNIEVDIYFSRGKLLHIGFKNSLSSYPFFDDLLKFIKWLWQHPVNNIEGDELIFPQPISQRNMFYYAFFRKKKIKNVKRNS